MRVIVTGASGLIGSHLCAHLSACGFTAEPLKRSREPCQGPSWNPDQGVIDLQSDSPIDGVIHLAGENIAQGRWNAAKKERIRRSRVDGTRLLAKALAELEPRPRVLVSASAIGFYGSRADEQLGEEAEPGQGFLAEVCQAWEEAARPAAEAGIRVVHPRIGVVLSPKGGALAKMLTPFKLGLGGIMGSGNQYMGWVAMDDLVAMFHHILTSENLEGPVNMVSPNPVTNRDFTRALGKALHRPTFLPMPAPMVRLAFGEMGDQLLLSSTRAVPNKIVASGYTYQYPDLEACLAHLLR